MNAFADCLSLTVHSMPAPGRQGHLQLQRTCLFPGNQMLSSSHAW